MSIKVQIDENTLKNLDYGRLAQIFDSNESLFSLKHYFIKRYNRMEQIILMSREQDDTQIKPIIAIESQLVDTATGYGLGKPVTYYDKNDDNYKIEKKFNISWGIENEFVKKVNDLEKNDYLEALLKVYDKNETGSLDMALLRDALITGSADEMIYTDTDGKIQIARVHDDCIAFYNNEIKPKMIGFARRIIKKNPFVDSSLKDLVYEYELYTNDRRVRYSELGVPKAIQYGGLNVIGIPFIRYDIGQSYISKLIAEIRSYELVTDNTKKILNYNDDAILLISGYMFEEGKTEAQVDEAIKEFKTKGALFLDSEDGTDAKWLTKQIDDGANENHKKNIKDDIYTIAGTFNPANDNQVYQNTLSLMFKLYGLETKMVGYLMQFKKGFIKRCEYVTKLINEAQGTKYDYESIDMTFTRNLPTNANEELNLINQAKDFLPLKELYKMVSFVDNPDTMVKKWKEWQLELATLEAQKSQINAMATQNDIMPDRLKGDNNDENEQTTL